jgi:hypothetical protein
MYLHSPFYRQCYILVKPGCWYYQVFQKELVNIVQINIYKAFSLSYVLQKVTSFNQFDTFVVQFGSSSILDFL